MARWIEIRFHGPHFEGVLDVHRIRNFAEYLVRPLHEKGLGFLTMDEADRAIDKIRISGVRTRGLRRSIAFIKEQIVEHGFSGDTTIEFGTENGS